MLTQSVVHGNTLEVFADKAATPQVGMPQEAKNMEEELIRETEHHGKLAALDTGTLEWIIQTILIQCNQSLQAP